MIWDRRLRRLVAARDPLGMRALYWATLGDRVAVASSSRALAELTGRGGQLNLASLGAQVAGLVWGNGTDTAFEGVDPLPAGHRLIWEQGRTRLERFWHAPAAPDRHPMDATEAALELQALLGKAVVERMGSGTTSVWMSGGWDSSAVFAAGQHALEESERSRLRPVSISYPEGDPGREDDFIRAIAGHWDANVHWIDSDQIPLLDRLEERAALTDEPPVHLYELWNRELARGSRAVGARVALDGCGGDNLFQVSDVILADLLRTGRLFEFARRARSRRGMGWKYLAKAGVLPLLPDALVRGGERVTGQRFPRHYMEHRAADWIRGDFAAAHGLRDRALATLRSSRGESLAQSGEHPLRERPAVGVGRRLHAGCAAAGGRRGPVAAAGPAGGGIRAAPAGRGARRLEGDQDPPPRAMNGLLPDSVLAPRAQRTGSTAGFSRRRMREAYPALLTRLFEQPLRLADLGIVEASALRAAADRWTNAGDESVRVRLFDAMRVEFWLRGLERGATPVRARSGRSHVLAEAVVA